jgi:predicted metal-binding membrane protein
VIYDDRDRVKVRNAVLVVAALAWGTSIWSVSMGPLPVSTVGLPSAHAQHHAMHGDAISAAAVVNWLLMLVAMMAPILMQPIQFLRGSSLARRRTRSTLLFLAGYAGVWICAGIVMLLLVPALGSSGAPPYFQVAAVLVIALARQCSPAKQACLNRCHALLAPAAFGRAADRDALVFGATQGVWCAGSCWAWMLVPLLLPSGHLAAMAAATVLIFCERLDDPAPVGWRWHGLGRVRRIVAQRGRVLMRARTAA